mgnify:CR=1 FL=1
MDWRECPTYRKYVKAIDDSCAKIVQVINEVKSRNLSLIAREARMPPALVHYYYDKLARKGIVKLKVSINFRKLGLTPVLVIVKPAYKLINEALEKLKIIDYWRSIARCYSSNEVLYYCTYLIPLKNERSFEAFMDQLKRIKIIDNFKIYWNPVEICPKQNFQWFDSKEKLWKFNWNEWVDEISKILESTKKVQLKRLEEEGIPAPLDDADIFIVNKLEEDAEVTFKELASMLQVTPPTIRYHYYKHLISYGILRGYEVELYPYPRQFSKNLMVSLRFNSGKSMLAFIKSLERKPFPQKLYVHYGDLVAVMKVYLMIDQVEGFASSLARMSEKEIVADYRWSIVDPSVDLDKTLPVNMYSKGIWKYPHDEYMRKATRIIT